MTRSNSKIIRDSLTKISISSYSIQAKMFCGQVSRPRLYRLKNEFRVTLFDQCCRFHKVDWLGIGKLESLLSQNLSGIVKNCRTHAERIKRVHGVKTHTSDKNNDFPLKSISDLFLNN